MTPLSVSQPRTSSLLNLSRTGHPASAPVSVMSPVSLSRISWRWTLRPSSRVPGYFPSAIERDRDRKILFLGVQIESFPDADARDNFEFLAETGADPPQNPAIEAFILPVQNGGPDLRCASSGRLWPWCQPVPLHHFPRDDKGGIKACSIKSLDRMGQPPLVEGGRVFVNPDIQGAGTQTLRPGVRTLCQSLAAGNAQFGVSAPAFDDASYKTQSIRAFFVSRHPGQPFVVHSGS